jgi:hypothetical protein
MLDHRNAGGDVPDDVAMAAGLPAGAGHGLYESATYTCSHCQYVVIIEPSRTRERAYCKKCDHRICDGCGIELARTGNCRPYTQVIDEYINQVLRTSVTEF